MPAELGEFHTSSLYSGWTGLSPKPRPSSRTSTCLRSARKGHAVPGTDVDVGIAHLVRHLSGHGPVLLIFLDVSRERSSIFWKAMLAPVFSW